MATVRLDRLNFVEVGDQSDGEYGFYEVTAHSENIGLTYINIYSYNVTFATYGNDKEGEINPKAMTVRRANSDMPMTEYLQKELFNYFLPYLQEKLDNLNQ
jgi:hypothetical protein